MIRIGLGVWAYPRALVAFYRPPPATLTSICNKAQLMTTEHAALKSPLSTTILLPLLAYFRAIGREWEKAY